MVEMTNSLPENDNDTKVAAFCYTFNLYMFDLYFKNTCSSTCKKCNLYLSAEHVDT